MSERSHFSKGHLPARSSGGAMVLELDSMEQASTWKRFMAEERLRDGDSETTEVRRVVDSLLPEAFSGQVRLPYLYGNRLVVTDVQVFDGVLMLAAGPIGVAELLGSVHRSDVMVMLRRGSARESLEAILANPSFHSSVEVAGWDAATIEKLRGEWIRAIDNQRVGSAPWRKIDFALELADRLAVNPPASSAGNELVAGLIKATNRSETKRAVESSGLEEAQQRAIFDWWNGSYMDVLALQHRSVWITTLSPEAALAEDGGTPATTLPIPKVIVDLLSSISGAEFATLVADAAPVLTKLRTRKRRIDRLRLALLVLDVGATPRPLIEFIALAARLVTFVLLIASAAFSGGWLAWLPSWLAILVAVLLIVVQLPFVDMIRFFRLFRRSSRAIMKTPGWLNERPE